MTRSDSKVFAFTNPRFLDWQIGIPDLLSTASAYSALQVPNRSAAQRRGKETMPQTRQDLLANIGILIDPQI